jgi:hypothetical protein
VEHRRRAFLTEPGDALVLARTALSVVERHSTFTAESGIDGNHVASSPLVAIPIPIVSRAAGPRGWAADANPALFWHPLFWLPPRVALRYRFESESEELDIETESEWTVRVALEVTLSELYSPADGTWLDVLAFYGLDVETLEVQNRVSAWLAGAPDGILDSIDLTGLIDLPGDVDWAVDATSELLPSLRPASWAIMANDLAETAGELTLESVHPDMGVAQVRTLVSLALATLGDVPARSENELPPSASWSATREAAASITDPEAALAELSESCYEIRDDYWPFVELLNREVEDQDIDSVLD